MNITDFIQQNKGLKIKRYNFPKKSAIYFICELDREIIYIGSTMNLQTRFQSHYTTVRFYNKPIFFFFIPIDKCIKLERKLIEDIKPKFNLQWIVKKSGRPKNKKGQPRDSVNIKKKMQEIMDERNISQTEMAKRMKVSRQRVNELLKSKAWFHAATIKKIATALNLNPKDLIL